MKNKKLKKDFEKLEERETKTENLKEDSLFEEEQQTNSSTASDHEKSQSDEGQRTNSSTASATTTTTTTSATITPGGSSPKNFSSKNFSNYSKLRPGEFICVDLKHMPESLDGENYSCIFTDLSTRLSTPVYLTSKDGFKAIYYDYLQYIRNKTGSYPKFLHSDGGGEFINNIVGDLNTGVGITHTTTAPYSSPQNPVAERVNRTFSEGSLAMLVFAGLPTKFWRYSIAYFAYVKMRTPHKHLNMSNPLTEWNIFNASKSHLELYDLRIFGSEAFVLDENSKKNDPKAFRCIYLGPSDEKKGSVFYNLHTRRIVHSRNFVINEQIFPGREIYRDIYHKYIGDYVAPDTTSAEATVNINSSLFSSTSSNQSSSSNSSSSSAASTPTSTHPNDIPDSLMFALDNPQNSVISDDTNSVIDLRDNDMFYFNRSTTIAGPGDLPGVAQTHQDLSDDLPIHRIDGTPAWEIVSIVDVRKTRFGPRNKPKVGVDYLVKWKATSGKPIPNSWEHESNVRAPELIREFKKRKAAEQKHSPETEQKHSAASATVGRNQQTVLNSWSIPNFCFYAPVAFLAVLTGLMITGSPTSWKSIVVPRNRNEMLQSPEREQWLQAERDELQGIEEMATWKRVKQAHKKPLTCRWVYKLKPPTSVQPLPRFKARLVVHGFKQKANVDYTSTFAQVATMKAFRILLWIGVLFGLRPTQLDVQQAFLYGTIDADIYLKEVPGYPDIGVVKLEKSLYGIRQAPRIWYQTLITEFYNLGFTELISDSCVFKHATSQCYILIFVDDIIILTNDESLRSKVVEHLKSKFSLTDMGLLRHFIGLQVDHDDDGTIHLHQNNYTEKVVDAFDDNDITTQTPYTSNCSFSTSQQPTSDSEKQEMSKYPYRQLIGSLLYLLCTRPELYFVIISLSCFVSNPGLVHYLAAVYVLRYAKYTSTQGITIKPFQNLELSVYCDSDWGQNKTHRKSVSGYILYLGTTPIIWRSRTQKGKAAQSSCEAEYRALNDCINEIVWVIAFTAELGIKLPTPIKIYCDNTGADDLAHNPVHHDRTKHIDIRFHRIREFIIDGTVEIHHIPTTKNPADLFTKCVASNVFAFLIGYIYNPTSLPS